MYKIYYITAPDIDFAKELCRKIIKLKLAACANILPNITSIYNWENEICEDNEVIIILKSKINNNEQLFDFIKNNHPYTTPCILEININDGNQEYLAWIKRNCH
jgi:periplasmic divalent cation tolerance protein